jgi:poly(A) polymerase
MQSCTAGAERPDVWRHTLDALEHSARIRRLPGTAALGDAGSRLVLRWTLLLHDIAKPDTLEIGPDGRPSFHGHESLGAAKADALLIRLRQPRELRRRVRRLVLYHLRPHHLSDAGAPPRGMRRLVRECGDDLGLLLVHAACDARASGAPDARRRFRPLRAVLDRLDELSETHRRRPTRALLNGDDVMAALGLPAGPEVGRWLDQLRAQQEEGDLRTRAEAFAWLRRQGRQSQSR